jgi:exopolysaccharide biosynthesis protein
MQGLAEVVKRLGCVDAYNLEGGATSVMVLYGEQISRQSNEDRGCGDILYIGEIENNEDAG